MKYPGRKHPRHLLATQVIYNFAREVERFRPDHPLFVADIFFASGDICQNYHKARRLLSASPSEKHYTIIQAGAKQGIGRRRAGQGLDWKRGKKEGTELILKKNKPKQFLFNGIRPRMAGLDGQMIAQMFRIGKRKIGDDVEKDTGNGLEERISRIT